MAIKARYRGDGTEYVNGVPAADLSDEDYEALTTEQKHAVRHTKMSTGKPLYDVTTESRAAARDKKEGD